MWSTKLDEVDIAVPRGDGLTLASVLCIWYLLIIPINDARFDRIIIILVII